MLMTNRFGHCLNDLLFHWKICALPIKTVAANHQIRFHCIKVLSRNW